MFSYTTYKSDRPTDDIRTYVHTVFPKFYSHPKLSLNGKLIVILRLQAVKSYLKKILPRKSLKEDL